MYLLVASRELSVVTSEYVELVELKEARFAIHQSGIGGFGFKLSNA
jgi:hypothetical protein